MRNTTLKRTRDGDIKSVGTKKVQFAPGDELETVHFLERVHAESADVGDGQAGDEDGRSMTTTTTNVTSRMTKEIQVISSLHGKARRHLREIPKRDLQAAIKYGVKKRAQRCRNTGDQRWKFTYANVVYITDSTCTREVTSYKESVTIHPCTITSDMRNRHEEVKLILEENPHLCTSHTFVVLDQSGSMRTADVNGFRNRSQAAYGSLALDYVASQLYEQPPGAIDTLTLVEMNDHGSIQFHREPLDWILFNELLKRQRTAKPRSHGDYCNSLVTVEALIGQELERLQ